MIDKTLTHIIHAVPVYPIILYPSKHLYKQQCIPPRKNLIQPAITCPKQNSEKTFKYKHFNWLLLQPNTFQPTNSNRLWSRHTSNFSVQSIAPRVGWGRNCLTMVSDNKLEFGNTSAFTERHWKKQYKVGKLTSDAKSKITICSSVSFKLCLQWLLYNYHKSDNLKLQKLPEEGKACLIIS